MEPSQRRLPFFNPQSDEPTTLVRKILGRVNFNALKSRSVSAQYVLHAVSECSQKSGVIVFGLALRTAQAQMTVRAKNEFAPVTAWAAIVLRVDWQKQFRLSCGSHL